MTFFDYDDEWHTVGKRGFPGHDENGFRNPVARTDARYLIVGDSQVYGAGVPYEASWPYRLRTAHGDDVYAVAMGGWGVLEYAMALERYANAALKGAYVCIYLGNDINEAFTHCRKSSGRLAKKFWDDTWTDIDFAFDPECRRRLKEIRKLRRDEGLSREEAVMRCVEEAVPDLDVALFNGKTYVLTPRFRTALMDLQTPANQCGLNVTKKAIEFMAGLSDTQGFELHIVLIPTREFVFQRRQIAHQDVEFVNSAVIETLYEAETALQRALVQVADEAALECTNLGELLSDHLHEGIYKERSDDGHPSAKGCQIIADHVHHRLLQVADGFEDENYYPLY